MPRSRASAESALPGNRSPTVLVWWVNEMTLVRGAIAFAERVDVVLHAGVRVRRRHVLDREAEALRLFLPRGVIAADGCRR